MRAAMLLILSYPGAASEHYKGSLIEICKKLPQSYGSSLQILLERFKSAHIHRRAFYPLLQVKIQR